MNVSEFNHYLQCHTADVCSVLAKCALSVTWMFQIWFASTLPKFISFLSNRRQNSATRSAFVDFSTSPTFQTGQSGSSAYGVFLGSWNVDFLAKSQMLFWRRIEYVQLFNDKDVTLLCETGISYDLYDASFCGFVTCSLISASYWFLPLETKQ